MKDTCCHLASPCVCALSQVVCPRLPEYKPSFPARPYFCSDKMKETIMNLEKLAQLQDNCVLVGAERLQKGSGSQNGRSRR